MASDFSIRQHIRHQVRDFLVFGQIKSSDVTLGEEQIFANRIRALHTDKLPCIQVSTLRESSERLNEAPVSFARKLTLEVICFAKADDATDDLLDGLAAQVEEILLTAFAAGAFLDAAGEPYVNHLDLLGADLTLELGESEIGAVAIGFEIHYDSVHEPALDDLERFHIEVKTGTGATLLTDDVELES